MGSIVSTLLNIWEDVMEFGRTVYKALKRLELKFYRHCQEMLLDLCNTLGRHIGTVVVDKHNIDHTMDEIRKVLESQVN